MIAAIFSSPIYMSYLVIFKPATIKSIIRLSVFLQCEDNLFLNIRALLLFGCRDTAMDRLWAGGGIGCLQWTVKGKRMARPGQKNRMTQATQSTVRIRTRLSLLDWRHSGSWWLHPFHPIVLHCSCAIGCWFPTPRSKSRLWLAQANCYNPTFLTISGWIKDWLASWCMASRHWLLLVGKDSFNHKET